MKTLGIVIPIYNTAEYLKECIDSILECDFEDKLVVLVDDGSTDISGEICDEYATKNTNVIVIHQDNQGKTIARYNGVLAAECEYITFVDSDDWIDSHIYSNLQTYLDQGLDLITYNSYAYYENAKLRPYEMLIEAGFYNDKDIRERILPLLIWNEEKNSFGYEPSLCTKITKRELLLPLLKTATSIRADYGDDLAITIPLMRIVTSYYATDLYGYYYRQRKKGIIPPYIENEKFYRELTNLYYYLRTFAGQNSDENRQLDMLYFDAVRMRMQLCYGSVPKSYYMFPFHLVEKDSKIAIYGAGEVGRTYYDQVMKLCYCDDVLWIDANKGSNEGIIKRKEELMGWDGDYIIIAIANVDTSKSVREELNKNYSIPLDKIIDEINKMS